MASNPIENPTSLRLIITVHGIRTFGHWQERLEQMIKRRDPTVEVFNYKYGYFSVAAFVVPFLRWLVTRRFRAALGRVTSRKQWDRIDIVAHSFGTHLVGWGLHGLPSGQRPAVHTVILAGSVLKPGFPWKDLVGEPVHRIVNECGIRDSILLLNQVIVLFTGMAGRDGFSGMTGSNFRNRYFDFGHSEYFQEAGKQSNRFMEENWLPLLFEEGETPSFPDPREPTAWRGFITFLINNSEPVKLALWVLPLLFLVVYIQNRRVEAEESRWAAQQRLADSLVALGDVELAGREYDSAFSRYLEALTLLDTLRAEQTSSGLAAAWKHLRNAQLPWDRQSLQTGDPRRVSSWPAELAIWNLLRSWQLPLNTVPVPVDIQRSRLIASASSGEKVLTADGHSPEVWNMRTGALEARLDGCDAKVSSLALSRDGTVAYFGTENGEMIVCSVSAPREEWRTRAHEGAVTALAVGDDVSRIVTGGEDGALRIWDIKTKLASATMDANGDGMVLDLSFSIDGRLVLATFMSGRVRLIDSRDFKQVAGLLAPRVTAGRRWLFQRTAGGWRSGGRIARSMWWILLWEASP